MLDKIGGISEKAREEWSRGWEKSQRSYPAGGVYFLEEEYLKEVAEVTRLRPEARPAFFESGRKMRSSEALSRLAWHCHWLLYSVEPGQRDGVPFYSTDSASRAPEGCTFFMGIVMMSGLPSLKAYYQSHGIPMSILSDTMTSFDIWTEDYHDHKGIWGCDHIWIVQGLVHNLFRLGRLEFQFAKFKSDYRFFRKKGTDTLEIIAPDGANVTDTGYICQKDETPAFTATIKEDANSITGYPVDANGRITHTTVTLDLAEWEQAFENDDPMICVHIPAAAPLEGDLTTRSIGMAREFFAKYFPLFKYKGFQSSSWLFDTTLTPFIPPDSNIARFQRNFRLFPHPEGTAWQTRERVFGNPDLPLDKVPQRTSLQRLVKAKMLEGHRFRAGCAISL